MAEHYAGRPGRGPRGQALPDTPRRTVTGMADHYTTDEQVRADARNRALRTLLQQGAFDVLAAVSLVIFTAVSKAQSWGDFEWGVLAFTVIKTATVTGLSYLMRTVLDGSGVPTPLPPSEPGQPTKPDGEGAP